jgi:CRP/FNR family nitrogen fixation transcriptional regulator
MQVSPQTVLPPSSRSSRPVPMTPAPESVASPDALDLLEQFGTTIRLARDQEIHAEGARTEYCYRVLSGCIRTVRLMEDGRRQVGEFMLPGDLFGMDDLDTHAFSAEAVCEAVVRRYPRRMVEALADGRPALARRIRELALTHLRMAHERIVLLGRKTAIERVASFVLELDQRTLVGNQTLLDLPMGRIDIADHLGLTVETVCRVLAHLKRSGAIGVCRASLRLLDRAALHELASEMRH